MAVNLSVFLLLSLFGDDGDELLSTISFRVESFEDRFGSGRVCSTRIAKSLLFFFYVVGWADP